jgi:outer membrane protein TolC
LSKSKIRKSLQRNLEYKQLAITRQQGDAMSHLLKIFNLESLYLNASRKLPIVFEQIEYYKLRQKIGAYNVRELSRAEMSKLKIENEITNLKARIDVELSKLASPETLSLRDLTNIPKFQYQFTEVPQFDCNFYDPELEIKQLDVEIKKIERDIARAEGLPTANLAFGISSKDYHPGAHANNYSIGLSVSGPLYSGGNNNARLVSAERKLHLAFMELSAHKEKFKKKRTNFLSLEKSLLRSIEQAQKQLEANELEIDELIVRQNAGFSVFEDLSERKLQRVELDGISFDLHNRLASFWVTYLENLSE